MTKRRTKSRTRSRAERLHWLPSYSAMYTHPPSTRSLHRAPSHPPSLPLPSSLPNTSIAPAPVRACSARAAVDERPGLEAILASCMVRARSSGVLTVDA